MKTILDRILRDMRRSRPACPTEPIAFTDGGGAYYPDLDYANQSVAYWEAIQHLSRLRTFLLSRGEEGLEDPEFRETALALIRFWLENDFTNPNWWFNQIGVPHALAEISFLLRDYLTEEQWAKAAAIVSRGSLSHNEAILRWTGANLIWGVRGSIYYALMTNDAALLHRASDRAAEEIRIGDGMAEGIKPDMSFWQHGPQLYSCGYGRSFTGDTARMIWLFAGTEFAIPEEKTLLFERFVLEGQRYMMRGRSVDPQTIGREICRPGALSSASLSSALAFMRDTPGYRHPEEIASFAEALKTGDDRFAGTKFFPYSCFLSHNTPVFHMAVKGVNTRFTGTEWGNFENLLGYNWAWGSTAAFIADGTGYADLNPVREHACGPGTTVPRRTDAELHELTAGNWKIPRGLNDDCFGWTNAEGTRGILTMRVQHDGIEGLAAWFAYEDGMICLGCGFTADLPLCTTVDQRAVPDDFPEGRTVLPQGKSLTAGGLKYHNLCDVPMTAEAKEKTGSWRRNNEQIDDVSLTKKVLTVTFDHPREEGRPVSYACAVLAKDADPAKIASVVNTAERQSVTFSDGSSLSVIRADGGWILG